VGGAERWYANLAERLDRAGHEVTYLTLRQWPRSQCPAVGERGRVLSVGPRMTLYSRGRRRIVPPLRFGLGVAAHLLRHGRRYDVVHTASFPYFSLLAAAALRPLGRYRLVVDWHEVWSRSYWRDYLGPVGGTIGYLVQMLCARLPQRAFCFSRLHAARLREEGQRGEVRVLEGEYAGPLRRPAVTPCEPLVVLAGRMIPEKRAPLGVAAVALAAERVPSLRGLFFGDGPDREAVLAEIARHRAQGSIIAPGFVKSEQVDRALTRALCMLLPSRREGYGMIVIEAAAQGTPSIVVAGEDNAASELIEEGVNGFVIAQATADAIAEAIVRASEQGISLRQSTADWFAANAARLSIDSSLERVLAGYAQAP
jgi:glycosyltransferase involved in cell wall biosynthesis